MRNSLDMQLMSNAELGLICVDYDDRTSEVLKVESYTSALGAMKNCEKELSTDDWSDIQAEVDKTFED